MHIHERKADEAGGVLELVCAAGYLSLVAPHCTAVETLQAPMLKQRVGHRILVISGLASKISVNVPYVLSAFLFSVRS